MWRGYSEQDIKEELGAKVKLNHDLDKPMIDVELVKIEPFEYDTIVKVKGFINDALLEQEKGFKFKLQKVSCDACMKLSSNYREAVIQLRAYDNKETDEMLKLAQTMIEKEKLHDSLSGIVKTVKVKTGGYDIWVGSKKASKKVVRYMSKLYKVQVISSKTLVGLQEGGKPDYRFTFCIKR